MRNKCLIKLMLVCLVLALSSFSSLPNLRAQVTIGSKEAPVEGAILDLK